MKRNCLLGLVCLLLVSQVHALSEGGPPVARVNGTPISQMRLQHYFADYLQAQGRAVSSIRSPTLYKRLHDAALDDLIDRELLWQEALKRGVSISDSQVQAQVAGLRQAFGSERFVRRLSDAGFDEQSFVEYTRRELAAQQVYTELGQVEAPDEAQVQALVEQNPEALTRPQQVRARHILLKVDAGAEPQSVEATRQRLLELRRQLVEEGADFATLARSASQDSSASEGGDLGYFSRSTMVPEFEGAAFALSPGEVSEPVRTKFGWHLILVENHSPVQYVEREQALAMARLYLASQAQAQARKNALAQLRSMSHVERIDER